MSDDELQAKLRSVFDKADVDGSGAVSTSEMTSMTASMGLTLTSKQLAAMMSEADTNGNGDMDFAEFTKVIQTRLKGASNDGVGESRRGSCGSRASKSLSLCLYRFGGCNKTRCSLHRDRAFSAGECAIPPRLVGVNEAVVSLELQ